MARRSTTALEQEHRRIQKVVATTSLVADRLDAGNSIDPAVLRDIIAFLHGFSEECHHVKEERFLFPLLEARGVPASGCPLAVLRNEHEKGRALLTQLGDATQAFVTGGAAKDALIITLRDLVRLYVDHIWKEEYLLLPMADKVLSEDDHDRLFEQFDSVEASLGAGKHRRLEELSQDWSMPRDGKIQMKAFEDASAGAQRVPEATGSPFLNLQTELHRL